MLILDENWTGERLCIKLAVLTNSRNRRLIGITLVPKGPGIESWRSCRFLGSMFRSLNDLPGGLGRFIPCKLGGNHCRLRHIGWEHSGHGLTSGSREKADPCVLGPLLLLFVFFPLGAHSELRYSRVPFARKLTTWSLPAEGTDPLHFSHLAVEQLGLVCLVWLEELEAFLALQELEVAYLLSTLEALEVRWISRLLEKLEAIGELVRVTP